MVSESVVGSIENNEKFFLLCETSFRIFSDELFSIAFKQIKTLNKTLFLSGEKSTKKSFRLKSSEKLSSMVLSVWVYKELKVYKTVGIKPEWLRTHLYI
jgi:hypothetical protein